MKKSYISILKYSSTNFFLIKIKLQDQLIQKQQQKIKKKAAELHILFFLINLFFFSYARVELEHIVTSSFWSLNMARNSTQVQICGTYLTTKKEICGDLIRFRF